uniref:Failed axon connections n=1 Tax=Ditylenchus dipsaci TaxID=166011 RepID=A0A915DK08_9BILA
MVVCFYKAAITVAYCRCTTWAKALAGAGAAFVVYKSVIYLLAQKRRDSPYVKDYEPGLVYLFQFPRASVVPNISPFAIKLETWLRIADIKYKNVENLPFSVRSREGVLPFVELDGIEYPDSNLAIRDLTSILNKESLETHLTDEHKAMSRAFEVMVENSLLLGHLKFRLQYGKELFSLYKPGLLDPVTKKIENSYIGQHSKEDISRISEQDLLALSNYLGTQHYFTGFKATKVDAAVFSNLTLILYLPFDTPQKRFIKEKCANLEEFCERVKARYWPDWEQVTTNYQMNTDWNSRV